MQTQIPATATDLAELSHVLASCKWLSTFNAVSDAAFAR